MDKPNDAKSKVLVVEDCQVTLKILARRLSQEVGGQFEVASTYEQVKAVLAENPKRFFAAIVDLYLPDARAGEVVDYTISKAIPPIILSAEYRQEVRGMMMDKPIVDYVVKRNFLELDYLFSIVNRLKENIGRKVLVVDDSPSCRMLLSRYLARQNFQVFEAQSAEEALVTIEKEPDVRLVITDQNMDGMKGSDMIVTMRAKRNRDDLAIIGVSGSADKNLNALFLKSGANDFFSKPFSYEELFCRVTQNIDAVTMRKKLSENAELDPLTNTYSRKYLMKMGQLFHSNFLRDNVEYTICLLKINEFEQFNDQHGLDVGEEALKYVGRCLADSLRQSDVVARVSDAEFCALCIGVGIVSAQTVLNRLISTIETSGFVFDDETYHVTITYDISHPRLESFSDCLREARRAMRSPE